MPTLAELLALPAGRTLDAAISEAMGREVEWRDVLEGHHPFSRLDDWPNGRPSWVWCSNYSTMIQAAWPLLAEMLAAGVSFKFWLVPEDDNAMRWLIEGISPLETWMDVPSVDDAPLAICRAWLAWKMSTEPNVP